MSSQASSGISPKQIIIPLLILLAALLVFFLLKSLDSGAETEEEKRKAPLVQVEPIDLSAIQLKVRSQGVFLSQFNTRLVAQVSGEIIALSPAFERGGIVNQGEILVQIDPFNYDVQLEEARAQLASANAAFILEEAQVTVAKAEWEKVHDTAPSELSLRKPQLEQARARVRAAEAGVKQAAKNLQRTKIISPFKALVAGREVSLGGFVTTGSVIGNVLDVSVGEVRLPLASKELQFLEGNGEGAKVQLSTESGGRELIWQGEIVRTEGIIDENSRMSYLVAEIRDPYGLMTQRGSQVLPFGAYVVANIQGAKLQNVANIPRHLVNKNKVAIYEQGKLLFRNVEVVRIEGARALVRGGLTAGEQLITSTLQYPLEGMALELIPSKDELALRAQAGESEVGETKEDSAELELE